MLDARIAVIGAGAAGLSLVRRLAAAGDGPSVVLLDAPPGPLRPPERTWCFWEETGGEFDSALTASWSRLRVRSRDGRATVGRPAPLRYKMLRSPDFSALVAAELDRAPSVRRLSATVTAVHDTPAGARVHARAADGTPLRLRARWVFDSRPLPTAPPARTTLLQHFRGWFVHTEDPVFDPATVDLMDFRVPQPPRGLAFGYVLPLGPRQALVEYTQFSPAVLSPQAYDDALHHYTHRILELGPFTRTGGETGVIPMTDAPLHRQAGHSVFRIGTAGGATRPATGYTFAAIQRQTRAIAAACAAGRRPAPPPCHSRRARTMDALLLRALATRRIDGPAFFAGLFHHTPTARLLRFLDGRTHPAEDLAIGLRTPVLPMLRTAAELPLLRRRTPPEPPR
ncbi:lycopene cyclase family protein [Streptomyces sp. RS10V-4]|uniref:lycopene cyclase family protein n=1 Tax=Streptomyces rhizoryzae TaxID=2932493 RepID=UPI0020051055|nr:lycopene cyclase family protein [Streptomyces rhizoryzae]MCK7622333.1 lycopene cyclase family protein [Streptomyces rhizoryzae]